MMVKSINPSTHGQYKKKVWVKTEESDEVEIQIEVYDIDMLDELFILYDKKGKLIIKGKREIKHLNLLV